MGNAQSRLDILINARNNAAAPIKDLVNDLGGLEKAVQLGSAALKTLGVGLTLAGGKQIYDMGMELARTAAYAEDVAVAFDSMTESAGTTSQDMLASLKKGSAGAISEFDLMLTANRAMLLEVSSSAEELGQLMSVAMVRSNAMGMTTQEAFNDIVTGIGRFSPQILDNLGIVIDMQKANEDYAQSLGKTADELTETEQKQALLNAVLEQSADLVKDVQEKGGDAAAKFERMDAAIQNAKDALGDLFQPAMAVIAENIAAAAEAAAEGMKAMADSEGLGQLAFNAEHSASLILGLERELEFLREEEEMLSETHQKGSADWVALQKDIAETEVRLEKTKDAQIEYNRAALAASAGLSEQNHAQVELGLSLANITSVAPGAAMGIDQVGQAAATAALQANLLQEQFNLLISQSTAISSMIDRAATASGILYAGKQGDVAGLTRQGEVAYQLERQRDAWRDMNYSEKEIAEVLMPSYIQQLQEADRATFSTARSTETISEEARKAQQAFEDLKGTVSSVLGDALSHDTGVDPDEVLEKLGIPRADTINENARRLADIAANGLKDQDWLGAFQNEVPDIWNMIRTAQNPQEEAAYLLRDFQDGLLTSAIDKGKAKEIVKRMILGDQKMSALAQEIAEELAAEMGVPLEEALAASKGALGVATATEGGVATGETFATSAAEGVSAASGGTGMVDNLIAQVQASYEKLRVNGREAGKAWGDGFVAVVGENIPPSLIGILTNLVTPEVMAKFSQQGTLTGAVP